MLNRFRCTEKMSRKYRVPMYLLCPIIFPSLLISHISEIIYYNEKANTGKQLTQCVDYNTVQFLCCTFYGFDKYLMTCIQH